MVTSRLFTFCKEQCVHKWFLSEHRDPAYYEIKPTHREKSKLLG